MKDKQLQKLIKKEIERGDRTINLIPSENYTSHDVLAVLGSELVNKYAEGYPGARYYGGNQYMDEIEEMARMRALKLFKLLPQNWSVNVQPYSGSPANLAVLLGLVPLGEKIMGMKLDMGGHLTHGHKVSMTGKAWVSVQYNVDPKTEILDYNKILELAEKEKPKLIIAGFTAYPRKIDFKKFRKIADAVGAYLMVDMSHVAGLVAGEVHPSPFPFADVVTTTTHKTLRGPRAAVIFSNRKSVIAEKNQVDLVRAIDKAVFPGLQGGPHMNQVAAIAVAMKEAGTPAFKKYAHQTVKNAKVLAEELKKFGWRIISGGTDNHLLLVDVAQKGISGKEAGERLERNSIIVNKNTIPYDKRVPADPSGIRLGTPAMTTRGMKERDMKIAAGLINLALLGDNVKNEAVAFAKKFAPKYR